MNNFRRGIPDPRSLNRLAVGGAALLGFGYLLTDSLFTVEGGHRAVMFNRFGGVSASVYSEGTHIKVPWFQLPIVFDVRASPKSFPSISGSKDLQMVNITVRVLTRPDTSKLPEMVSTLGTNWGERVLPSIVEETLKSVIAQFTASELLTMRESVSSRIRARLQERAGDFNIVVEDVSITHLTFGQEYMNAVEAKQVALQEAERAKYVVDKAVQDKRAVIVRAQGEAESAKMITEAAVNNPAYLALRKIELAQEISELIAQSPNRIYLNADSLMIPINDLMQKGRK
jgi:prohibitin 2